MDVLNGRLRTHVAIEPLPPFPVAQPSRMADSRGHRERARSAETYIHDDSQSTLLIIDLYEKSGTAGTRTQDQSLKRALLYQLSYRPNEPRMIAELARQFIDIAHQK